MSQIFILRQPLINKQSKIIANRLSLYFSGKATMKGAADMLGSLLPFWLHSERLMFINCANSPAGAELFNWTIPGNAIFEVSSSAFTGPSSPSFISELQEKHPFLCLLFDAKAEDVFKTDIPLRFIGYDLQQYTPDQLKSLVIQNQSHGISVAFNVYDEKNFQACLDAGISAAASWYFKHPRPHSLSKTLNPTQGQIIRVLNLVRNNAEVREIEAALKHDVALPYKLLRYINSAGFGLSCEIQSFRHAVTILGYEKLNKWLSLLLATASKDPMAPALLHTSLTRARLMEIVAKGLVDAQEYDNLFITGAFSLIDVMLGVTMESVLNTMNLPEPICDALLGRGGIYCPFLDLVKACEGENGEALAEQAGILGLSVEQFNSAQMQALAFAEATIF